MSILNQKNILLDYVSSGMSHTRITYQSLHDDMDTVRDIDKIFESCQGKHNHTFSFLYNAYTESKIGEIIDTYFTKGVHEVYSDSGGLQVITAGKSIDQEMKYKVYETQAKYSDIAMSFDEIPLKLNSDKSKIGDTSNRFFDVENFESAALLSARNLEEQIDFFINGGHKTKPLMIVHGNNMGYYSKWAEIMYNTIPKEKHEFIGGISISGASSGNGVLEDVERMASFAQLPLPDEMKTHLHLLGVGSIVRILPLLGFAISGLFSPGMRVSYDSTTHSASMTRGNFFLPSGKILHYGRYDTTAAQTVKQHIMEWFPGYIDDIDPDLLLEIFGMPRTELYEKYSTDPQIKRRYHLVFVLSFLTMVMNFTKLVDNSCVDKKSFRKVCVEKDLDYLSHLTEIKTLDDYQRWFNAIRGSVKSIKIKPVGGVSTLDSFFE